MLCMKLLILPNALECKLDSWISESRHLHIKILLRSKQEANCSTFFKKIFYYQSHIIEGIMYLSQRKCYTMHIGTFAWALFTSCGKSAHICQPIHTKLNQNHPQRTYKHAKTHAWHTQNTNETTHKAVQKTLVTILMMMGTFICTCHTLQFWFKN